LHVSSHGIRDRVAIIGMGCTPFVEAWGKGLDDLVIDAAQ
jgi:acetyl-CoA C-acetyltransferase